MSERTEVQADEQEKRETFELLAQLFEADSKERKFVEAAGMTYGWKFVGRALSGRTFEQATGGK